MGSELAGSRRRRVVPPPRGSFVNDALPQHLPAELSLCRRCAAWVNLGSEFRLMVLGVTRHPSLRCSSSPGSVTGSGFTGVSSRLPVSCSTANTWQLNRTAKSMHRRRGLVHLNLDSSTLKSYYSCADAIQTIDYIALIVIRRLRIWARLLELTSEPRTPWWR